MEDAFAAFIAAAQAANPDEPIPAKIERVWSIGSDQEVSAIVVNLIKDGEKTGTFRLPAVDAARPEGERPKVGGYGIVTDLAGTPGVMIKTLDMEDFPYKDISHEHVQLDGPAMRDLDAWRKVHWDHFANQLKALGKTMSEDEPVTVEKWTVVYAPD